MSLKVAKNTCTYLYIYLLHDHVSIMPSFGQNSSIIDLNPPPVEASIWKTLFSGNAAQAKFVTSRVDVCLGPAAAACLSSWD